MKRLLTLVLTFLITGSLHGVQKRSHFSDESLPPIYLNFSQPLEGQKYYLFGGGEFLWFRISQTGLDYTIEQDTTDSSIIGEGDRKFVEYQPSGALRGFLGFRWGCDGWESRMTYTHVGLNNEKGINAEADRNLAMILALENEDGAGVRARSEPKVDYQTLDIHFSRPFCLSPRFMMQPYFGFRGLWLRQDIRAKYRDTTGDNAYRVKWSSNYSGFGLRAGSDWNALLWDGFCGAFSFNTSFSYSITYGWAQGSMFESLTTGQTETVHVDVNESFHQPVSGFHMGAGFSYETSFFFRYVILSLGYEFNQWLETPEIRRYYHDDSRGAAASTSVGGVLLHGFTTRIEAHF